MEPSIFPIDGLLFALRGHCAAAALQGRRVGLYANIAQIDIIGSIVRHARPDETGEAARNLSEVRDSATTAAGRITSSLMVAA